MNRDKRRRVDQSDLTPEKSGSRKLYPWTITGLLGPLPFLKFSVRLSHLAVQSANRSCLNRNSSGETIPACRLCFARSIPYNFAAAGVLAFVALPVAAHHSFSAG